jgi:methionyl aminopeptidase
VGAPISTAYEEVEPMINAGRPAIRELADGWTIVTKDHSLSAQWEHTVLVTEAGHEVLTLSADAPPMPRSLLAA